MEKSYEADDQVMFKFGVSCYKEGQSRGKIQFKFICLHRWYLHRCLPLVRSEDPCVCPAEILPALGSPMQALSTFSEGDESLICPVSHLQMYFTVAQITIDACAVKLSH